MNKTNGDGHSSALHLLEEIKQFVPRNARFTAQGLARGLGHTDVATVIQDLVWLRDRKLLTSEGDGRYLLAQAAWKVEEMQPEDDDPVSITFVQNGTKHDDHMLAC